MCRARFACAEVRLAEGPDPDEVASGRDRGDGCGVGAVADDDAEGFGCAGFASSADLDVRRARWALEPVAARAVFAEAPAGVASPRRSRAKAIGAGRPGAKAVDTGRPRAKAIRAGRPWAGTAGAGLPLPEHEGRSGERGEVGILEGEVRQAALDERGVERTRDHRGIGEQQAQVLEVRRHSEHDTLGERRIEAGEGLCTVAPPHDDLREHRIVVRRHDRPHQQGAVDAHVGACTGFGEREHGARSGQESPPRVLRVEAGLDGVAGEADIRLPDRERLPGGDAQLPGDDVDSRHELCHGVLDLQSGIHLEEVEGGRVGIRDEELHGPRTLVAHAAGDLAGGEPDALAGRVVEQGRGCLLDDLLVAALQRALPLAEVDHVPEPVGEHLHLDVSRSRHEPLEQQGVVAERGEGDPTRRREGSRELGLGVHDVHAFAPSPGRRLDEQGESDAECGGGEFRVGKRGPLRPVDNGHPAGADVRLRPHLVAHHLDRVDPRPDEDDARGGAGLGEGGILGEEPVARVDGLGTRGHGRGHDRTDVEVAGGRRSGADAHGDIRFPHVPGSGVGITEDRDRADAQLPQRAYDPAGDLAAIGDEHRLERGGPQRVPGGCGLSGRDRDGCLGGHRGHIRKRPKAGSGSGASAQTSRARPSTVRVSAGSITPSSHSRAVEYHALP